MTLSRSKAGHQAEPSSGRDNQPWWAVALEIWNSGTNTLLCGATATGKTTVLEAIVRLALEAEASCFILSPLNDLAGRMTGFPVKLLDSSECMFEQIKRLLAQNWVCSRSSPQRIVIIIDGLVPLSMQQADELEYVLRISRKQNICVFASAMVPTADHWRRAAPNMTLWNGFSSIWQFEIAPDRVGYRVEPVIGHLSGVGAIVISDRPDLNQGNGTATPLQLALPRYGEIDDVGFLLEAGPLC